jgi:putative nucleotidyltransferase with HDIG domain
MGDGAGSSMDENLKILVVDDEEIILNIFKDYLEATKSYTVLTARDGFEGLDIIKREKINCCITDLSMPKMDGVTLTEKIHDYDNTIPVIVMTGYPSLDNAVATLKNGVVDFLTKPIRMDQVAPAIEKVLHERSLFFEKTLLKEETEGSERLLKINQELQEKIKEVETINLIFQQLDQATTSGEIFNKLVNISGEVTACDEAHFSILGREMNDPTIITSFLRDRLETAPSAAEIEEEIVKKVADDGMPLIVKENDSGDSVMAIPLKIKSTVFGVLSLIVRNGEHHFCEKDLYLLNFLSEKASFLIENMALYENIYENLFSTLYAFVETIEARDPYTKKHSTRVTSYAVAIAEALGCPPEEIEILNVAGNLHDIGKIGIRDSILLKPGRLTDKEFEVIKRHPTIGSNIIGHYGLWTEEQKTIKHHHERWDGDGYPDGLKGEEIPFFSRVLSVADVYDALTSDRSYREKLPERVAVKMIQENIGGQFDPKIAGVFLGLHKQGRIYEPPARE